MKLILILSLIMFAVPGFAGKQKDSRIPASIAGKGLVYSCDGEGATLSVQRLPCIMEQCFLEVKGEGKDVFLTLEGQTDASGPKVFQHFDGETQHIDETTRLVAPENFTRQPFPTSVKIQFGGKSFDCN
jgi:hypothetical protein